MRHVGHLRRRADAGCRGDCAECARVKAISPKPRKCAICPTKFVRARPFETWCSPECGLAVLRKTQNKAALAAKREHRIAKARIERIGDIKAKAQAAFNKFIRVRDAGKPCISCGRPD